MKNYIQRGDVITVTAAGAWAAGQLVLVGEVLGVTQHAAESGSPCEVALAGVFELPKVSAAVIAAGETMVWDVSANDNTGAFDDNLATPALGDISGGCIAIEGAGSGAIKVKVKLLPYPPTVKLS